MITINGENFSESDIEKIYKKISEIKIGETISKEELESFLHCLKEGTNDFKGVVIIKNDEPQNTDIQNNESEIIKEKEEPLIFSLAKPKRTTEIQQQEKTEKYSFSLEKTIKTNQEKQEKQEKGMKL